MNELMEFTTFLIKVGIDVSELTVSEAIALKNDVMAVIAQHPATNK